jgi:hypothetical protein
MQQYVCKPYPACGCQMTPLMGWTLRELRKVSLPIRGFVATIYFARMDPKRRTHNAFRMVLRTLVKRRYVVTNGFDQYRITHAGELWCEEHPE